MDWPSILGALGSVCSISSFVPQAWKVVRTGETRALSLQMYLLTVTGFAFWTAYGCVLAAWPIIVTNATCFLMSTFILFMKLRSAQRNAEAVTE